MNSELDDQGMRRNTAPVVKPQRPGLKPLRTAVVFLVLSIAVTTAAIVAKDAELQRKHISRLLQKKIEFTQYEFNRFFIAVEDCLAIIEQWGRSGVLKLDDLDAMNDLLVPLIERVTQISSLVIARPDGWHYGLVRTDEGWANRFVEPSAPAPQQAQWFLSALRETDRNGPHWSRFSVTDRSAENGVTATVDWKSPGSDAGNPVVSAAHIRRKQLDRLAAQAPITDQGVLFVFDPAGSLIWLSAQSGLLGPTDPEYTLAVEAVEQWRRRGKVMIEPFPLQRNGTSWWGAFYAVSRDAKTLDMGVLIPISKLDLGPLNVSDTLIYGLFLLVLVAACFVVFLAFRYHRKLAQLVHRKRHHIESEDDVRDLIEQGEGKHLEFKSTLRWNLKADKAGREIELAWLKSVVAYLNSEGGILLIGVSDDGAVLGIGADRFDNEDKMLLHFNNVIKRHIGLEFSKYIHARILGVGDQRIVVVQCEPAPEASYLRDGEDESFYIRAGPSSRKLPTSKIIDYLNERAKLFV